MIWTLCCGVAIEKVGDGGRSDCSLRSIKYESRQRKYLKARPDWEAL